MFKKKWYFHTSDDYFKSHHLAFHNVSGPFRTKTEALEVALWHSNQAMRNGTQIIIQVNKDKTTNSLVV